MENTKECRACSVKRVWIEEWKVQSVEESGEERV